MAIMCPRVVPRLQPVGQALDSALVPLERCPICRQDVVEANAPHRPFCSERCRLLDFSAWTTERYRFPGDPVPTRDPANDDDDDAS